MGGTHIFNTQENEQDKRSVVPDMGFRRDTMTFGVNERRSTEGTVNVVCMDISTSMNDVIGMGDSRKKMTGLKESVSAFIAGLPPSAFVGGIAFSSRAYELFPISQVGNNRINLLNAVQSLSASGVTAMKRAYGLAIKMFSSFSNKGMGMRLFFFTDGMSTDGSPKKEAEQLKKMGIDITAIGFGEGSNIDESLLRDIASVDASGKARYEHFTNSGNLTVFMRRASKVY